MIKLITFGPMFGMPDPSPFCMKAMALLKIAGLEYSQEAGDPRKAPKGKIPWLDDDGLKVPDTTLIRMHLEKKYNVDFYPGLSEEEKSVAWAFEKMCEEHLYFSAVYDRWMIDANFDKGPRNFFNIVPTLLRPLVVAQVRRSIKRDLHGHGMGRHSHAEVVEFARRDIDAIAGYLGDKPYFMGEQITGADAVIHAFVAAGLVPLFDGPIRQAALAHPNLVAYVTRLNEHWYPGEMADLTQ